MLAIQFYTQVSVGFCTQPNAWFVHKFYMGVFDAGASSQGSPAAEVLDTQEAKAPRSQGAQKPSAKCQVTKALGELHSLISSSI